MEDLPVDTEKFDHLYGPVSIIFLDETWDNDMAANMETHICPMKQLDVVSFVVPEGATHVSIKRTPIFCGAFVVRFFNEQEKCVRVTIMYNEVEMLISVPSGAKTVDIKNMDHIELKDILGKGNPFLALNVLGAKLTKAEEKKLKFDAFHNQNKKLNETPANFFQTTD